MEFSRLGYLLIHVDRGVVAHWHRGVQLLIWGVGLLVAATLARGAAWKWLQDNPSLPLHDTTLRLIQAAGAVVFIIGAFFATHREPAAPDAFDQALRLPRRVARTSSVVVGVAVMGVIAIDDVLSLFAILAALFSVGAVWGFGEVLGILASRSGDDKLARRGRFVSRASRVFIVIPVMGFAEWATGFKGYSIRWIAGLIPGPGPTVQFLAHAVMLAGFVYVCLLLLLLSSIRRLSRTISHVRYCQEFLMTR